MQLGSLTVKSEGCWQALLISVRFFCILTVSLVMFGTAPFLSSIKAMRSLGLPRVIVDMSLLSYRLSRRIERNLNYYAASYETSRFSIKGFEAA